jgi:hypothetical protein
MDLTHTLQPEKQMIERDKPASLRLAERILDLFEEQDASEADRWAALGISRALVPVTAAAASAASAEAVEPSNEVPSSQAH